MKVSIYPNGGTMYTQSPSPSRPQPKRGNTRGWSQNVSRRNTDFLLSVEADKLTGHGFALSLTIKDAPDTPGDWRKIREAYFQRLRRMGMTRLHWLTEWQGRGCPHMHAAVWFEGTHEESVEFYKALPYHWLEVTSSYGSQRFGQYVAPITGSAGWFEYLAKHATRGIRNYQRSQENIPKNWTGSTGRMWGHTGDWPTKENQLIDPPPAVWHQYRRLMLRYQIGKARRQGDKRRVGYLRRYRSQAPQETSRAQALPRVWIPAEEQWQLLGCSYGSHGVAA